MDEKDTQGGDSESKVFVGDLTFDNETDLEKIRETIKRAFKNPSVVLNVKVNLNRSKQATYYAFVTFATP